MITKVTVNGKEQDIIITNAYEDSEFFKRKKNDFPHSVLDWLLIITYLMKLKNILVITIIFQ